MNESLIHTASTAFILSCCACIIAIAIWALCGPKQEPMFPRGYSAVEQARAIIEQSFRAKPQNPAS
jgi:hypothetical protein